MKKFTDFIEKKIAPPLIKFSNLKYVQIMQRSFIGFTALLIIGSLFLLLAALPIPAWQAFVKPFYLKLATASTVGTGFMALYVCVSSAYATIEWYNKKNKDHIDFVPPMVLTLASWFLVVPTKTVQTVTKAGSTKLVPFTGVPTDYLGAKGVFAAMLVGIVTVEIYRFVVKKNWTIKMPQGVPPMVASAFASLIPSFFVITFWWIIATVLNINIPQIIMSIFEPLVKASDTAGTVFIVTFLNRILWSVGIHGGNVVGSVAGTFLALTNVQNQAAFAAGKALPHMFTGVFYDNYIWIGLAPLAIVMSFSKSKQIKTLGLLALPAALFNIGEPLIFGIPIVMNPIMMIPFVLGYMIIAVLAVILTATHIIPVPVLSAPWIMPAPLKTLMATNGSIMACIYVLIAWIILALIFYPFVKVMEKQDLNKQMQKDMEQASKAAEKDR